MSDPTPHHYATRPKLDEARAWLSRFTRRLRGEPFSLEIDLWGVTMEVCPPGSTLIRLLSATNGRGPMLLILHTPRRDAVVWEQGSPVNPFDWLCDGITTPLTSIRYAPGSNTLGIGLAVESLDWSDTNLQLSDLLDRLLDYLWAVSYYIEKISTEPSLDTPLALQLRRRFQASLVTYPVAENAVALS